MLPCFDQIVRSVPDLERDLTLGKPGRSAHRRATVRCLRLRAAEPRGAR